MASLVFIPLGASDGFAWSLGVHVVIWGVPVGSEWGPCGVSGMISSDPWGPCGLCVVHVESVLGLLPGVHSPTEAARVLA